MKIIYTYNIKGMKVKNTDLILALLFIRKNT